MEKSHVTIFLLALMLCSLVLAGQLYMGKAQSGTPESGLITGDITWAQANSPYNLAGNLLVANGATLTVEAGATVSLGSYYIEVNGTLTIDGAATVNSNSGNTAAIQINNLLTAIGSASEPVNFNGGEIDFSSSSAAWNPQTGSGCIIQGAILNNTAIGIDGGSPKINDNTLIGKGIMAEDTSAIITNNHVTGVGGRALYNTDPMEAGGISTYMDSATVSGNVVSACSVGIQVFAYGNSTVTNNLLVANNEGIQFSTLFDYGNGNPIVENNTVTDNTSGISFNIAGATVEAPIIVNNNIFGNEYNFDLENSTSVISNNLNATYNWWGTTATQAINKTIYDFKDDFNLGNVTFVPFSNSPNTEAPTFVEASAGSNGVIAPNGFISLNYGGSQTFTITANSGYYITNVLVNGTSIGAVSSYTIQNLSGPTTISATFSSNQASTSSPSPSSSPTESATPGSPSTSPSPSSSPNTSASSGSSSSPSPSTEQGIPEFSSILTVVALFVTVSATMAIAAVARKRKAKK